MDSFARIRVLNVESGAFVGIYRCRPKTLRGIEIGPPLAPDLGEVAVELQMKFVWVLSILALVLAHQSAQGAITPNDFDVISVVPRSPSIKPMLMPITKQSGEDLAAKTASR
ncbi:MAG TPA: hypothetical protein VFQ52_11300 [Rhizomicrobium sp.]|nr:hypothetical protein [Rhizomicrobium sp.]